MERSSFPDPDPSVTVIDPSLIYTPTHTYTSNTSSDAGTSPPAPDLARCEHTSPTPNPDHPSPASSRAQSQPSELAESWKSPRPQDHSRNSHPRHAQRPPHLQRPSSSLRQRPYTPRPRRPGPTSAPSSTVPTDPDESSTIPDVETYTFKTYQDQTTLVMGVLVHLDALARQCEDMKTFIKTGFGDGNEDMNDGRSRIERCALHPTLSAAATGMWRFREEADENTQDSTRAPELEPHARDGTGRDPPTVAEAGRRRDPSRRAIDRTDGPMPRP